MRKLEDIREQAEDISFWIDGYKYWWGGLVGNVVQSCERGVKKGDIRAIAKIPFYAYSVRQETWPFSTPLVNWVPIEDIDYDWIREFKRILFR